MNTNMQTFLALELGRENVCVYVCVCVCVCVCVFVFYKLWGAQGKA